MSLWIALAPWRRARTPSTAPIIDEAYTADAVTPDSPTRPLARPRIQLPESPPFEEAVTDVATFPPAFESDDWLDAETEIDPPRPATVHVPLDWDPWEVEATERYDDEPFAEAPAALIEIDVGRTRGR